MSNPTRQELSEKDTWQTPPWLIDGIKQYVTIDLDPCAGKDTEIGETNWSILCGEDGLERDWHGTVFCNPPFSEKDTWVEYLIQQYRCGNVERVFLVTPDSTDVKSWWHGREVRGTEHDGIVDCASYVCFMAGRVQYIDPETGERKGSPSFGTAISMFGSFPDELLAWFGTEGWLVEAYDTASDTPRQPAQEADTSALSDAIDSHQVSALDGAISD
jgi:phage N-6-adenine-methyltransferase